MGNKKKALKNWISSFCIHICKIFVIPFDEKLWVFSKIDFL